MIPKAGITDITEAVADRRRIVVPEIGQGLAQIRKRVGFEHMVTGFSFECFDTLRQVDQSGLHTADLNTDEFDQLSLDVLRLRRLILLNSDTPQARSTISYRLFSHWPSTAGQPYIPIATNLLRLVVPFILEADIAVACQPRPNGHSANHQYS